MGTQSVLLRVCRLTPLLLCTALSGCLTTNVLMTIRPDGSGTVEYTAAIRAAALKEFRTLLPPEVAASAPPIPDLSDLRQWRVDERIGYGLRLRSSKPVSTRGATGWTMIYEFDDVEMLGVDVLPVVPGTRAFYGIAAKSVVANTRLRTSLDATPDGMERLTVRFPRFEMDPTAEPPASWATGTPEEMAALRKVFSGARLTIAVQTEAPLVQTNSPFRDGNRVTLLDADVEEALFSKPMSMLVTTPSSFEELLTIVADLPGVTLAREHDITLDFHNPSLEFSAVAAGGSAAESDVFLSSLASAGSRLVVGPPKNISRNPGYDDQPSFTPDGQSVLFASARARPAQAFGRAAAAPPEPEPPRTDIYRYDIAERTRWRVTNTPEAEYSPFVMPDGRRISLVRVEADNRQRLWSVTRSGESPTLALPGVSAVGCYAWIDARTVALCVPGDRGLPDTLQIADTMTGTRTLVATDIGRSLERMPSGAISFVQHESAGPGTPRTAMIKSLRRSAAGDLVIADLMRPPAGLNDPVLAWTPDGRALAAIESAIYLWTPRDRAWTPAANLGAFRLHEVSRLAVSPQGDRLAIVAKQGTSLAR